MSNHVTIWNASEWVYAGETAIVAGNNLGISANITNEGLRALATSLEETASQDGIVLDGDVFDVLAEIRDAAIAAAFDEAEG